MKEWIEQYIEQSETNELFRLSVLDANLEDVKMSLEAGADPNYFNEWDSNMLFCTIELFENSPVKYDLFKFLLEKGVHPAMNMPDQPYGHLLLFIKNQKANLGKIFTNDYEKQRMLSYAESLEIFEKIVQDYCPKFESPAPNIHQLPDFRRGRKNPELITDDFYYYVLANALSPYEIRHQFRDIPIAIKYNEQHQVIMDLKSARNYTFNKPLWTFQRFGTSRTLLPDGSVIFTGGEHEDFYDPDFLIFNDVIKVEKEGNMSIYFYQEHNFPPTDFHTATLVGSSIFLIGNLGYQKDRQAEFTPVYQLDVRDFSISAVKTKGTHPGWISKHTAIYVPEKNAILVFGGKVWKDGQLLPNDQTYSLNLKSLEWTHHAFEK